MLYEADCKRSIKAARKDQDDEIKVHENNSLRIYRIADRRGAKLEGIIKTFVDVFIKVNRAIKYRGPSLYSPFKPK